jgi:hypothetical protein
MYGEGTVGTLDRYGINVETIFGRSYQRVCSMFLQGISHVCMSESVEAIFRWVGGRDQISLDSWDFCSTARTCEAPYHASRTCPATYWPGRRFDIMANLKGVLGYAKPSRSVFLGEEMAHTHGRSCHGLMVTNMQDLPKSRTRYTLATHRVCSVSCDNCQ